MTLLLDTYKILEVIEKDNGYVRSTHGGVAAI